MRKPTTQFDVLEFIRGRLIEHVDALTELNCEISFAAEPIDERDYDTMAFVRPVASNPQGQEGGLLMDYYDVTVSLFSRAYLDQRETHPVIARSHLNLELAVIQLLVHEYFGDLLQDPLTITQRAGPRMIRDGWLQSDLTFRCMIGQAVTELRSNAP